MWRLPMHAFTFLLTLSVAAATFPEVATAAESGDLEAVFDAIQIARRDSLATLRSANRRHREMRLGTWPSPRGLRDLEEKAAAAERHDALAQAAEMALLALRYGWELTSRGVVIRAT